MDAREYSVNPFAYDNGYTAAVADCSAATYSWLFYYGSFFAFGLTADDVGGLCYLLSTNNLTLESLIPGVRGSGRDRHKYVNTAIRPGVDKITFLQLEFDTNSARFIPITNHYIDTFIVNNRRHHQRLERVITEPDILFTVQDIETQFHSSNFRYTRTGTSNWVNNGAPSQSGPGVIQPPVVIAFDRLGPSLGQGGFGFIENSLFGFWGSYDGTTNAPIVYPIPTIANSTEFRFALAPNNYFSWNLYGQPNAVFLLQTSADLLNWTTVTSITNIGGTFSYLNDVQPSISQQYFRTIPQ